AVVAHRRAAHVQEQRGRRHDDAAAELLDPLQRGLMLESGVALRPVALDLLLVRPEGERHGQDRAAYLFVAGRWVRQAVPVILLRERQLAGVDPERARVPI